MSQTKIRKIQSTWDRLGKIDPLWAVLAWPDKKGKQWDEKEFFETGKDEVRSIMDKLTELDIAHEHGLALDFGCGVGRLTNALAHYYQKVIGVDVAPSMIDAARKLVRDQTCEFVLNPHDNLAIFADNQFDFVYSTLTLQHLEPIIVKKYLKEFARIMKPGAALIFQMPAEPYAYDESLADKVKRKIADFLPEKILPAYLSWLGSGEMAMKIFGIKKAEVVDFLDNLGLKVPYIEENSDAGKRWKSYLYFVVK